MGVLQYICSIFSEHLFLRTTLGGCFYGSQFSPSQAEVLLDSELYVEPNHISTMELLCVNKQQLKPVYYFRKNNSVIRAYSSCSMHAIVARMRLPFLKIFSNFLHFCPHFQIFCPFLPFFLKIALMPFHSGTGHGHRCQTVS